MELLTPHCIFHALYNDTLIFRSKVINGNVQTLQYIQFQVWVFKEVITLHKLRRHVLPFSYREKDWLLSAVGGTVRGNPQGICRRYTPRSLCAHALWNLFRYAPCTPMAERLTVCIQQDATSTGLECEVLLPKIIVSTSRLLKQQGERFTQPTQLWCLPLP